MCMTTTHPRRPSHSAGSPLLANHPRHYPSWAPATTATLRPAFTSATPSRSPSSHSASSTFGRTLRLVLGRDEADGEARRDRTAIVIPDHSDRGKGRGGQAVTYAQLRALVDEAADKLVSGGLQTGDVACLALPNDLAFVIGWLASTSVRAVAAPLNPEFLREEFEFYLRDVDAKLLIVPKGEDTIARTTARDLGIEVWEIAIDIAHRRLHLEPESLLPIKRQGASELGIHPFECDIALMLHTSGTTGRPKAVPLTHGNLVASLDNISRCYALTPADRSLVVMPLFHVHGLIGCLLATLYSGGTAVVQSPKFSATHFWPDFLENGCTWYSAVPTIHQILLRCADRDYKSSGSLRFIRSCSAALAPATLSELEKRFKAPVIEAYAMTEASHQMTANALPPGKHKPGSVGRGVGVEVGIFDERGNRLHGKGEQGEVCIKGPTVMKGYYHNPAATAASFTRDGFFRTGDQGFLDEDGYLVLVGRIKEMINRGGEKISPIEVDETMLEHESVAEAVSFAVPDEKYGEEIHAAVVLKPAFSGSNPAAAREAILAFCRNKLSAFKCPKELYIASDLPRTATGKIQRRFVAQHFLQQAQKEKEKSNDRTSKARL